LPLHFAALTGESADPDSLVAGVRESLPEAVWREALLQATLPYLPRSAANSASQELAKAGFSQEIDAGFRLHPLAADALRRAHPDEVRRAVQDGAQRLPVEFQAEALARAGMFAELDELIELDPVPGRLGSLDPTGLLRWDALCLGPAGPGRLLARAWALSVTGQADQAVAALNSVRSHPDASEVHVLTALGWQLFELLPGEVAEAEALISGAEALLSQVAPKAAASFLANASIFFYKRQDWARVGAMQERALSLLEGVGDTDDHEAVLRHRLAEVNWEQHGDLHGYIAASEQQYLSQIKVNPYNAMVAQHLLGVSRALLSDERALTHLREAENGAAHNPIVACCAAAERAALTGEVDDFAGLAQRFRPWSSAFPEMEARIRELWARTLRRQGAPAAALDVLDGFGGPGALGERALALAALDRVEEAVAVMPSPEAGAMRQTRLELEAANYLLHRREEHLDAIVGMTQAGIKVLPALLPFGDLPTGRPELSDVYPVATVLASRWAAAVERRLGGVPPLQIELLGQMRVRVLGEEVALSTKHREIVCLMALGFGRVEIGEALWPEAPAKKVQNNLHVQLTLLRRLLEPWGVKTYLSEAGLERAEVDLWALRQAIEADDIDSSLRLYREPLAPGIDLPEVDDQREELRSQLIQFWKGAALGVPPARAIEVLEQVLRVEPFEEEAMSAMLKQLISVGREREAKRRYRDFADRLKQELGLEPLSGTASWLQA